ESCFRHSSALFTILATRSVPSFLPALSKSTRVTIPGVPLITGPPPTRPLSEVMKPASLKIDVPATKLAAPIRNPRRLNEGGGEVSNMVAAPEIKMRQIFGGYKVRDNKEVA